MDEIIYEALGRYYKNLELKGYEPYKNVIKLLVLIFYRDFVYNDYRGNITKEDYYLIEKALDCLYGTTCLIPYPDYLKMGRLYLGEVSEISQRLKKVEEAKVLKAIEDNNSLLNSSASSDVEIVETATGISGIEIGTAVDRDNPVLGTGTTVPKTNP